VAGHSDRSVKALLDHGADVNARNEGGITALMIAAATNQADLAGLLIGAGADQSAKDETGKTALGMARDKGNDAVIKLLEQSAPATHASTS
jgi:ankyrin repeat protein